MASMLEAVMKSRRSGIRQGGYRDALRKNLGEDAWRDAWETEARGYHGRWVHASGGLDLHAFHGSSHIGRAGHWPTASAADRNGPRRVREVGNMPPAVRDRVTRDADAHNNHYTVEAASASIKDAAGVSEHPAAVTYDSSGPAGRHGVKRVYADGVAVGHVSPHSDGYEAQDLERRPLGTHPTLDEAVAHVASASRPAPAHLHEHHVPAGSSRPIPEGGGRGLASLRERAARVPAHLHARDVTPPAGPAPEGGGRGLASLRARRDAAPSAAERRQDLRTPTREQIDYIDRLALRHGRVHVGLTSPYGPDGTKELTVPEPEGSFGSGVAHHVTPDGNLVRTTPGSTSIDWRQ